MLHLYVSRASGSGRVLYPPLTALRVCSRLKIQPLALPHINCAQTLLSVRTRVSEKAGLASLQMQRGGDRERNGALRFDLLLCECVLVFVHCRVRVQQCDDVYHVRHALLHAHASDS